MLVIKQYQETGDLYNTIYKKYQSQIITEHLKVFNKEDINGYDCGHLKIALWHSAILYSVMLYMEQKRGFMPLSAIRVSYLFDSIKSCLECQKIPLTEMLKTIGIDFSKTPSTNGIEFMAIEQNNIVEDCKCIPASEDLSLEGYIGTPESIALFNSLWESESYCKLLLNSNC